MTASTTADLGWATIDDVDRMDPFLMTLSSDQDHWFFAASNGGLTAGRHSPDQALFPYVTQDKLIDMAAVTGSLTRIRVHAVVGHAENGDAEHPAPDLWRPLDPTRRSQRRRLEKRLDGTQLRFSETSDTHGLTLSTTWGFSRRFGFVRRCVLHNHGDRTRTVDLLDGVQNVQTCGLADSFHNQLSVLVNAYTRVECLPANTLRLVYLSSVPTDRAEPSESLRCTTVWMSGLPAATSLITTRQVRAFETGGAETATRLASEVDARGQRAACLDVAQLRLPAGARHTWYTVAEVNQSTAAVTRLDQWLSEHDEAQRAQILEQELRDTSAGMRRMVASADGLQRTQDARRQSRHFSNVMFNIMRGGLFLDGEHLPRRALIGHLRTFNRPLAQRHAAWLDALPQRIRHSELLAAAVQLGDPDLERLVRELLPLSFGRRHGDPSRPWNRFAIAVHDARGRPLLSYQGNWRDIFQNWEALVHAYPGFVSGTITRFVDASTADGYNPYRLTSEGFDWERPEPDEPWSNIGYWGDHQIIYLLRLLEASRRFTPGELDSLLAQSLFTYARVPYRINPYDQIVADPHDTITYDTDAERQIDARVETMGADGQLLAGPDGQLIRVTLFEKLLVPLLAKLANFVPGGGIWMNTQRPEWNDANNALVGNGVSVVTLAYCHRYVRFLTQWWGTVSTDCRVELSVEVAALLAAQVQVFDQGPPARDAHTRRAWMDALGGSASAYRLALYDKGLCGRRQNLELGEVLSWLGDVQQVLAHCLWDNQRSDRLFNSYNLLRVEPDGGVELERLYEMLEGQVAVLSADLLSSAQVLEVATALRGSALYRPDQDSYLLYPDRDLPRFLVKNRLTDAYVEGSTLAAALAGDPDQDIIERDVHGALRFAGHLRNGQELSQALAALPSSWQALVAAEGEGLVQHLAHIFDHHAFTGRSGTFFAYEGLGSIYWHMVSKLVLALQENALTADDSERAALARAYHAALQGLGMHKDPAVYGAFPTDAYSHTPKHAGAQQPGMTGQVKEDVLIRWGELGVVVAEGRLAFRPVLLSTDELLASPTTFSFVDVDGQDQQVQIPAQGLAFTFCQVPVLYTVGERATLRVLMADGDAVDLDGDQLPFALSAQVFARSHQVRRIEVTVQREQLWDPAR